MTKAQKRPSAGPLSTSTRYDIHCPVTVSPRKSLNGLEQIEGELWEISENEARVLLDKPLPRGTEVVLFVHFRHPHKGITTIRFQGVVETSKERPVFIMTVGFRGGGKFVPTEAPEVLRDSAEGEKSPNS